MRAGSGGRARSLICQSAGRSQTLTLSRTCPAAKMAAAVPIGCWDDCLGTSANTLDSRTLPVGVAGCCNVQQDPPGACPSCKTACVNPAYAKLPTFIDDSCPASGGGPHCPTCVEAQMTVAKCADYCAGMGYSFSVRPA